jgi:hypothetical protein
MNDRADSRAAVRQLRNSAITAPSTLPACSRGQSCCQEIPDAGRVSFWHCKLPFIELCEISPSASLFWNCRFPFTMFSEQDTAGSVCPMSHGESVKAG